MPSNRAPSPDDDLLDTDSEVDEFGQDGAAVTYEVDEWGTPDSDNDQEVQLQSGLSNLPLYALAKAGRRLDTPRDGPGPGTAKARKIAEAKAKLAAIQHRKGKVFAVDEQGVEQEKVREEVLKRESKNAPTAISSKRQVSRHRMVVDVPRAERRDPRFSSVSAGQVDPHLHEKSYTFLPGMLKQEVTTLRKALQVAIKVERTCPWAEKTARTAEREKIEQDLGRVRTRLERTEREAREREVLASVKREERDKQSKGKGAWYMKRGEKKDLLLKTRFDALEKQGGKTAVKKVMEKKRQKVAQKEKKSRPFASGSSSNEGQPSKRRRV